VNNRLFSSGRGFGTDCLRAGWALAVIILLATIPVLAQQSVGTILGIVRDTSGGTVAGATVMVLNSETSLSRSVTTGDDGAFRLPALPVGRYSVKIEKEGFKTETRQGMVLDVAQELVVNASLEVGSSAQEVVVTGEAPIVNTTTSSLGGLVNEQKMDELPLNGRNFIDLSLMQPGVVQNKFQGTGGGMTGTWFSSNGSPTRSNYVTLDGAPMINQLGGSTGSEGGTTLGVDGIREYRIITNNFGAEYGMTMGSQMVIVTKSGTNQWHGGVFEYLRNDHLDARNFFDTAQTAGKTASGEQRRLPVFQRNSFGASAGGPIRKDKTFFYATYEGLRQIVGFTALDTVIAGACHPAVANAGNNWGAGTIIWNGSTDSTHPRPAGSIGPCTQLTSGATTLAGFNTVGGNSVVLSSVMAPLLALMPFDAANPTSSNYSTPAANRMREDFGQIRIDQNISANDAFFGRFTISDAFMNNASGSIANTKSGAAYPQYVHASSPSRNQFYTLSESHVFSGALLNTARASFSRTNFSIAADVSSAFRNSPGKNVEFMSGRPMGNFQGVAGMSNIGTPLSSGPNPPSYHKQNIYTFSDDIFYTRGKHALKFGFLFNRFNQGIASAQSPSGQVFFANITNVLRGVYSQYIAQTQGIEQTFDFIYNTFGFYLQDDIRATSKLTFNLGLRYEINTTPHELLGAQAAFRNPTADATSTPGPIVSNPSLHNFSPRVGFAYDVQGNGKTAIRGGFGLYYDIGNIGNALFQGVVSLPPLMGQSLRVNPTGSTELDLPFFSNLPSVPAPNTLQTIQYGLSQPQMLAYNLTIERQFPGNLGLAVSYVGTRGTHLFTEMEANANVPSAFANGVPQWFPYLCAGVRSLTNTGTCTLSTAAYGLQTARINPNWSTIVLDATAAQSWYNSLQVVLNKRLGHGLQFQSAYTWSHSLDVAQGQGYSTDCSGAAMASGMNPFNPRFDTGPSCFDVTHNWRFNLLYHFPNLKSSGFVSKLANGWWMGNIVSINTGYPFSPAETTNRSLSGQFAGKVVMERASIGTTNIPHGTTVNGNTNTTGVDFIPYDPATVIQGNPNQWFNPLMFQLQPIGTFGTASRGLLRGPGSGTWDFSLVKDTSLPFLGERGSLQFRAEFFNLLNRANFGMPAGIIFGGAQTATNLGPYTESPASAAGKITTTSTDPREIQLALKLVF
jgi:hypothetical protein